MFRDIRVGAMHYLLFLGSTVLLIGNTNAVTGGLLQAVVSWPFDGALWAILNGIQNVIAVGALLGAAYAFERRLYSRPSRLEPRADGSDHPGDDHARGVHRIRGPDVRGSAL